MEKYFLYARKSTDTEDKQVLSIDAQINELRKYARDNGLDVVDELIEKRTAKMPGRPIFNEMLERIQNGEANGILAWHPDRLARNSIDGGQIVYLLDQTLLNFLRFPIFQFENTSQGKFMLAIMFGQSKYFVDNLSENTKRGLRARVRNGDFPGLAPFGYINDVRSKTIVVDKRYAPLLRQLFEQYARGDASLRDLERFLRGRGVVNRNGKPYGYDKIIGILKNPFYYGDFIYWGEIHEGRHEPLISKSLWDKVQKVIALRSYGKEPAKSPAVFGGLLNCACGMSVTHETQKRTQKNGNYHEWVYYRCTHKSKSVKCFEKPVSEFVLKEQISALVSEFIAPTEMISGLRDGIDAVASTENGENRSVSEKLRAQIHDLNGKQQVLLDTYLDQDIDRPTFLAKKNLLAGEKRGLDEKLSNLERNQNCWIEPTRKWLDKLETICCMVKNDDFLAQKQLLLEIYGSNLLLKDKNVVAVGDGKFDSPWILLRKILKNKSKTARMRGNFAENSDLEPPPRFELGTPALRKRCSSQLS